MIYVGSFCARLNLIGRMKGIVPRVTFESILTTTSSVRVKLRACEPGFDITTSFFICVLYKGYNGATDDYELGFLQSLLLVKVRCPFLLPYVTNLNQVYKHIFTSPTSAKEGSIKLSDVENDAPAPQARKVMKSKKAI